LKFKSILTRSVTVSSQLWAHVSLPTQTFVLFVILVL